MPSRKEYLRRLASGELTRDVKKVKLPEKKKRRKLHAFHEGPFTLDLPDLTKREKELQQVQFKQNFLTAVGTAANVPTSFTLGYLNSLMTIGFGDTAFFHASQRAAFKKLEVDVNKAGWEVKKKMSNKTWIVKNTETKKDGIINPSEIVKDKFPKDMLQWVGKEQGFDITPEDQFAYDVGSVFGSIKSIAKAVAKAPRLLSLSKPLSNVWHTSKVGVAFVGVEQMQKALEGEDPSFKEAHQTAGMFVAFGVGRSMISGSVNWYKMNKFLRSPEGVKALGSLTKAEGRLYLEAGGELHKIGQKEAAESFLALTASQQRTANVALKGVDVSKRALAEKLITQPTMPIPEWKKIYADKLNPIFKKLGKASMERQAAAKTSASMTRDALAAVRKPKPIGDVIPQKGVEAVTLDTALEKSVAKSPYANMPNDQVKELANYGVSGAKEFLEVTGKITVLPSTPKQRNEIILQASRYGLSEDAFKRLTRDVGGVDEVEELTKDEAAVLIERLDNYRYMDARGVSLIEGSSELLTIPELAEMNADSEMKHLRNISGGKGFLSKELSKSLGDQVYNGTINYMNQFGPVPTDKNLPDLPGQQRKWIELARIVAKQRASHMRKVDKFRDTPRQANALGTWQHIGYALADMDVKAGIRIRDDYLGAVADVTHWSGENEKAVVEATTKAGLSRLTRFASFKSNAQVEDWLNAEDDVIRDELWNGMTESTRASALAAEELYQGESASRLRWAQYKKWDFTSKQVAKKMNEIKETGRDPKPHEIKAFQAMMKGAQPFNAEHSDLIDAQTAESIGQLQEYLASATWGTRLRYTPHESDLSNLFSDLPGGSIPQEVFYRQAKLGTLPLREPSAIYGRKGEGDIRRSGNAFLSILNHMDRLSAYASTFDARVKIWDSLKHADLSTKDEKNLRRMMDTLVGVYHPVDDWLKITKGANSFYWKQFLSMPRNALKFAYRQAFQNPALMGSQFDVKEVTKALARFPNFRAAQRWQQNNPDSELSYREYFNKHISESRAAQRFLINKAANISGLESMSKAGAYFDFLGRTPAWTDWVNRKSIWPVAYWMAETNMNAFQAGKINMNQLWKRLKIDIMPVDYQNELRELVQNDPKLFKSKMAEYKTEAIHMRYKPMLRSTQEMTPLGRTIFGPVVFARGIANIAIKNGFEPMLSGSPRRAWEGAKSLIKLALGGIVANEVSERTTGYNIYDPVRIVLGIGPFDPGMGSLAKMFMETSQIARQAPPDTPPTEIAVEMVKTAGRNLEHFIALADVIIDLHRVRDDKDYIHLWDIARKHATGRYEEVNGRKFKRTNRDVREKMFLLFMNVEPADNDSDYQSLQKTLGQRSKKTFGTSPLKSPLRRQSR